MSYDCPGFRVRFVNFDDITEQEALSLNLLLSLSECLAFNVRHGVKLSALADM